MLLGHVWSAYCRLSNRRNQGFNGPDRLTPTAIKDWLEITGEVLNPWEVDVIFRLDDTYMRCING